MPDIKSCSACEHSLDLHVKSVLGNIVCLHVETGTSSGGITGLPYHNTCDCHNNKSEIAEYKRKRKEQRDKEQADAMNKIIADFKEKNSDVESFG